MVNEDLRCGDGVPGPVKASGQLEHFEIPVRVAANGSAKTSLSGIFFSTGYLAVNLKGLVESQTKYDWTWKSSVGGTNYFKNK